MYDNRWKFAVFIFTIFFSSFVSADTLTWEKEAVLVTDNATFIAGGNFTLEEIWTQMSQIMLNGSYVSAISNGINPNVTLIEFFTNNVTSFDIQAQNNSWVLLNLNSSVYGKPINVTLNGSLISENVSWFYYPSNTTVTVNTTYNSSQRISLTFAAPSTPPTTTTTTATTTTLASGGAGGSAGGSSATTTTTLTTTTAKVTIQKTPEETIGNETLKKEVQDIIGKVQDAIARAESLNVDVSRSKELLAEAYRAYDHGDYVLAKAIAEQASNEALGSVQEKSKEQSKIPLTYLIGIAGGAILIFGLAYWKRDYLRERITPVKPVIEGIVSKLKVIEMKKHEVMVKPIKLVQVKIDAIVSKPEDYANKDVEILECKIIPLRETDGGWLHTIDDGTATAFGLSTKRIEGKGTVEGTVRLSKDGKPFIEF